jgi:putative transposase
MVRAGGVKHPDEWPYSGYNEIQAPKRKNILINYERLRELLGFDTYDKMKTAHLKWVESCLINGDNFRDEKWTNSIAVGSEHFIGKIKTLMGGMALGRKSINSGECFQLRETQSSYNAVLGGKKSDIDPIKTFFWN